VKIVETWTCLTECNVKKIPYCIWARNGGVYFLLKQGGIFFLKLRGKRGIFFIGRGIGGLFQLSGT